MRGVADKMESEAKPQDLRDGAGWRPALRGAGHVVMCGAGGCRGLRRGRDVGAHAALRGRTLGCSSGPWSEEDT